VLYGRVKIVTGDPPMRVEENYSDIFLAKDASFVGSLGY
jgi:hypothetical protein